MDKRQALLDKILNRDPVVQLYRATVKSVQGKTCTVELVGSDLEVDEVALCSDPDGESTLILTPKSGSVVLVGLIENDITNLYVAQVSDIEKLEFKIDQNTVKISADKVELMQEKTAVVLSGGKVEISNSSTSLKDIFTDLATILQNFKVVTSTGPSTALFADTLAAVTQFKAKYPQLLK